MLAGGADEVGVGGDVTEVGGGDDTHGCGCSSGSWGGEKQGLVSCCAGCFINEYSQWADSGDVDAMIGGLAGR